MTTKMRTLKAMVAIVCINIIVYLIWSTNYYKTKQLNTPPVDTSTTRSLAISQASVQNYNISDGNSLSKTLNSIINGSFVLDSVKKTLTNIFKPTVNETGGDDEEEEGSSDIDNSSEVPPHIYDPATVTPNVCRKNHTWNQLVMSGMNKRFNPDINIFLDDTWQTNPANNDKKLPFGLKGISTATVQRVLDLLPETGLPLHIQKLDCVRCVVVAHGSVLRDKNLGKIIDSYDVVFRMNQAPWKGYEKMIGTKSTFRISYPEGASQSLSYYKADSVFIAVLFKDADLYWVERVAKKDKNMTGLHFWKSFATSLPHNASMIRILNPALVYEAGYVAMYAEKEKFNNRPTIGTMALGLAVHMCDEVAVAGMGYNLKISQFEYYYGKEKMKNVFKLHSHNVTREELFRSELKSASVIDDLTGGIE